MIQLYFWPTPNGYKASIMLEEVGLDYVTIPVDILAGEQFKPGFLAINPNNRVPAIVDLDGPGGAPYSVFESGALLLYLAEKTGKLWPIETTRRYDMLQWLMFQISGVGPMFGQNGYFQGYCPKDVPLAKARYHRETLRLYGVMDKQLADNRYLAGDDYSLADIATYPWTMPEQWRLHHVDIEQFPHVKRWNALVAARPAVGRGSTLMTTDQKVGDPTKEAYANMFGDEQYRPR